MCQLFSLASGILGALNPMEKVTLRVSIGHQRNPDYSVTPIFQDYEIFADLQSLNAGQLLLSQNINQQAENRSAYLKGTFHALNRPLQTGGDFIILSDGSEWLITSLIEEWGGQDDWCKIMMTRQKPSAPSTDFISS